MGAFGGRRLRLSHLDANYLGFELLWKTWRYYEPCSTALFASLCAELPDEILDVGANIGWFSLLAGAAAPRARLTAIEANPKMAAILRANLALNGTVAEVIEQAASAQRGEATWYQSPSDMSGTLDPSFNAQVALTRTVQTTTLDHLVAGRGGRMLLKIDVEGHEPEVLAGAQGLLTGGRQLDALIEAATPWTPAQAATLAPSGLRLYHVTDRGLEPAAHPGPLRRGDLLFLNLFATRGDQAWVDRQSAAVRTGIAGIDLRRTSKYRPVVA